MDETSLPARLVKALDPRPGEGWGGVSAARTPVMVGIAILVWLLSLWGVPVPEWLPEALTILAAAFLGHDAGVFQPTPR